MNDGMENPMDTNGTNNKPQPRKDLSAMKHYILTITGLLALGLAVSAAFGGEPLPLARSSLGEVGYGHADFVPTPERPMIFRAGGNGYYPGATPPTEWSEGTPVQVDMKTTSGNSSKEVVRKVWDFADTKSKNILWKVPVPGWGYSHPIVVRDPSTPKGSAAASRVISLGSPHFVTCYDLKTGKQLWQREALPLLCDGQPEDKARAAQVAIDLAMAICKWGANEGQPFALVTLRHEGKCVAEGFQERAAKVGRMLAKYRPAIEKIGDPDLLTALDADLALVTSWEKTTDAVQTLSEPEKKGSYSQLAALVDKKYKVSYSNTWSGYVGFSDAAPASDGERIYAVFGQGQVVCYDLEGKLLWAKRLESKNLLNGNGFASNRQILLVGDRLVVKDVQFKKLLCFHAKTGELLWTYPCAQNNFMAERHLRLTAPDGAPVDVIITPEHHKIVRLSDGKELGEFRAEPKAPHYNILAWDDTDTIVVGGKSTSGPLEPSACYRIKMTGPDSATGEVVYELEGHPMTPFAIPIATDTHIFAVGGGIYDRKTGAKVGQLPDEPAGASAVIAGHYLIKQGVTTDAYGRKRQDNMATCTWLIYDISDPAKPRKVNQGLNLLGYKDPPADYIVTKYLAEFDPFLFVGCYFGAPSWFGTDLAGVVPHGNKLLIQSSAFLYCIGEK
jgi:outer membrane protein assembly factor BamB